MEIGGVNLAIAFLAGAVSCISPCVLPLAPIFAGSLAGSSSAGSAMVADRKAPLLHAISFMAGFVMLFIVLGASVGLVGYVLRDQLPLIEKAGGIFLIVLGLHMARIIELSALYRGVAVDWSPRLGNGYLRSFLTGTSISAGWLPCIGPTLGTILTLALASGTVIEGSVLLFIYSVGLAVLFVAIGAMLSRTPATLRWLNRHHEAVTFVSGVVMIIMGVLVFSGTLQELNAYFNFSSSGLASEL